MARSYYPYNDKLCVLPTGPESQFESFQAIFARILHANIPPATDVEEMTPYELMCHLKGLALVESKHKGKLVNGIFFKPSKVTHYVAVREGRVYNPYEYFQAKDTQGFCQMFAYFLAINDVADFYKVVQKPRVDEENFVKLALNNLVCLHKIIDLITANEALYTSFKLHYDLLVSTEREVYGIKARTSLTKFFNDAKRLTLTDAAYYVIDNPLVGIKPTSELRNYYWSETIPAIDSLARDIVASDAPSEETH